MKPKGIRDIRFPKAPEKKGTPDLSRFASRSGEPTPSAPFPRRGAALFIVAGLLLILGGTLTLTRTRVTTVAPAQSAADPRTTLLGYWEVLKNSFGALEGAGTGLTKLLGGMGNLATLPKLFLSGQGEEFLLGLGTLQENLESAKEIFGIGGDDGLGALLGLGRAEDGLSALQEWLGSENPRHVIVLFGNTSELRPGGGFNGSFAELTLKKGALEDIVVHDVNDADRVFRADIVPPQPLQAIARRWRIADANWFFDYPASARKIAAFLGRSELYKDKDIDMVVAVSPAIVRDILSTTGPLILADGVEVNSQNFLALIQSEVQEQRAAGDPQPKHILADLALPLERKLAELNERDLLTLLGKTGTWITEKDLMVFSSDERLQKIFSSYRADGALYSLPGDFRGDYLAAVFANIGGGKSDFVVKNTVALVSTIHADGMVENSLAVTRAHGAGEGDPWWYRVPNESYLKVFTPKNAVATRLEGGFKKAITPKADYRKGFERDPDVAAIESSLEAAEDVPGLVEFEESEKNVFGFWTRTLPGETSTARLEYFRKLSRPLVAGDTYTFIFESQAGASTGLKAVLRAPEGFEWAETDSREYVYENIDPPGRLVIDLTLQRA